MRRSKLQNSTTDCSEPMINKTKRLAENFMLKMLTPSILIFLSVSMSACSKIEKNRIENADRTRIQELKATTDIPYYIQRYCETTNEQSSTEILKCYQYQTLSYDRATKLIEQENKSAWVEKKDKDEWTDETIYVANLGWIFEPSQRVGDYKKVLLHYQSSPPEIELQIKCQSSGIDIEVKMPKKRYASSLRFRVDDNAFFDVALSRLTDTDRFSQYHEFQVSDEMTTSRILRELRGAKTVRLGLLNYNRSSNLFSGAGQTKPSKEITDTQEISVHGLSEEFIMNCAKYSR